MIGCMHACRNALDQGKGRRRTRVTISVDALELEYAALVARTLRDSYDRVSPSATRSWAGVGRVAAPLPQLIVGGA